MRWVSLTNRWWQKLVLKSTALPTSIKCSKTASLCHQRGFRSGTRWFAPFTLTRKTIFRASKPTTLTRRCMRPILLRYRLIIWSRLCRMIRWWWLSMNLLALLVYALRRWTKGHTMSWVSSQSMSRKTRWFSTSNSKLYQAACLMRFRRTWKPRRPAMTSMSLS